MGGDVRHLARGSGPVEDARVKLARAAAWTLTAVMAAVGPAASEAWAQTATGSPTPTPRLTGEVSGSREPGGSLAIRVDAVMPGGWDGLHLVEAALAVGGGEVARLRYDIEETKLSVDGDEVVVGTGDVASGDLLSVRGSQVIVTTGAGNLSFTATADVLRAIPEDARFELSVTGDRGETASVTRSLEEPGSEGITWGTVVTAVLLALLAGGFVGNLYASRRRPPPRLSVYGSIQRRLDAERSAAGDPER